MVQNSIQLFDFLRARVLDVAVLLRVLFVQPVHLILCERALFLNLDLPVFAHILFSGLLTLDTCVGYEGVILLVTDEGSRPYFRRGL